ncbi:hypothetical protein CDAR_533081 [Caerostris darwini]|uniref:Uncharacterized protein CG3556 n=1 Tax=Caerostris darwini TaxID=1538125 RepID=A0AAV4PBE7_9ARAC|nr:uncharacterized protein CG3556 [Caerostris darwini]GIY43178.1 hypothetical protein CDAR_533081 [Caerostris darwini]
MRKSMKNQSPKVSIKVCEIKLSKVLEIKGRYCNFCFHLNRLFLNKNNETTTGTCVHENLFEGGKPSERAGFHSSGGTKAAFMRPVKAALFPNIFRTPKVMRHEFLTVGKKTTVHSIAGRHSDIERGIYWTLYRKVPVPFRPRLSNTTVTETRLKLLGAKRWTKDLRKLHPRDGENLAFWYKPFL